MKSLPVAVLAGLLGASHVNADALGQKTCADAEVVGRIVSQDYRDIPTPPGYITTDVLVLIDFDVRDVRFGPVKKGPLRIRSIQHTLFNGDREIAFYLRQLKDNCWWISLCDDR